MRLLLVEADTQLATAAQEYLRRSGLAVDQVCSGRQMIDAVEDHCYEAVVLSTNLPGDDPVALLARLRRQSRRLAVLVTIAMSSWCEPLELLELGADDYLRRPYTLRDLAARITATTRRLPPHEPDDGATSFAGIKLSPLTHAVTVDGKPVALTRREYSILELFIRRKNQVLTRSQIEESVYGWNEEVASNTVEVYIHGLRRKLGTPLIHTIRGVGYQLASEAQPIMMSRRSPAEGSSEPA
ncbi:response regulator transcription factor [Ramlibacter sp. G-1-2-2]|uniref:Response regulator transcription factor n=1 Tax=Ramlibacter agri TaxID=2728837 RepID=A0A848H1P8_9BURK|nr:response regulator transcription factor [Ramlibacter agri]